MANLLQLSDSTTINLDHVSSISFLGSGEALVYLDFAYHHKDHDEEEKAFLYLEGEEAVNLKMYVRRDVRRADSAYRPPAR